MLAAVVAGWVLGPDIFLTVMGMWCAGWVLFPS